MKWNGFISSIVFLLCTINVAADDSIKVLQEQKIKYERRMQRRQQAWASLIPTHYVIQNAGNMGTLSAGVGWSYGKNRKWELDLLFGFIPKHDSSRPKFTTTLKGNYIPWRVCFVKSINEYATFAAVAPYIAIITESFGIHFAEELFNKFCPAIVTYNDSLPEDKKIIFSRMALFYEISTCDLYIRSIFQGNGVKFTDIFGCSIGMKFYTK